MITTLSLSLAHNTFQIMSGTVKKLHVASIGVNSILFVLVRLILKIMFVQSIKENIHVHIGKILYACMYK